MLSTLYAVKEAKYVKLSYIALQNVMNTLEKCLESFFFNNKHLFLNDNFALEEPYGRLGCDTFISWNVPHRRAF